MSALNIVRKQIARLGEILKPQISQIFSNISSEKFLSNYVRTRNSASAWALSSVEEIGKLDLSSLHLKSTYLRILLSAQRQS